MGQRSSGALLQAVQAITPGVVGGGAAAGAWGSTTQHGALTEACCLSGDGAAAAAGDIGGTAGAAGAAGVAVDAGGGTWADCWSHVPGAPALACGAAVSAWDCCCSTWLGTVAGCGGAGT